MLCLATLYKLNMAAAAEKQEEISCGYCLQKSDVIEDARILPCNHICCMECLEADFRKLNTIECPVCMYGSVLRPYTLQLKLQRINTQTMTFFRAATLFFSVVLHKGSCRV